MPRPRGDVEAHSSEDPPLNGVLRYRVDLLEKRVDAFEDKLDQLQKSINGQNARLTGFIFTFAGAMLLLALNLLVMR